MLHHLFRSHMPTLIHGRNNKEWDSIASQTMQRIVEASCRFCRGPQLRRAVRVASQRLCTKCKASREGLLWTGHTPGSMPMVVPR